MTPEPRRDFLKQCALAVGAVALYKIHFPLPLPLQPSPGLPLVPNVELQPLIAQVKRLVAATDYLGVPFSAADKAALGAADTSSERIQRIVDRACLFGVNINPESRVKVVRGPAQAELVQNGWRQFLVKVHNEAGTPAALRGTSPQAQPLAGSEPNEIPDRWLDLMTFDRQPLTETLSGPLLEYPTR